MPFQCSICGEESTRICALCTKDACNNHLCEKCGRCSDCCECEVALFEESKGPSWGSARAAVRAAAESKGAGPESSPLGASPVGALPAAPEGIPAAMAEDMPAVTPENPPAASPENAAENMPADTSEAMTEPAATPETPRTVETDSSADQEPAPRPVEA